MKKIVFILLICLVAVLLIYNISDKENDQILEEENENKTLSPLSGISAPISKVERRPVAVMFDNHPNARWQAGLSQAEIVYEFFVEYPYTRYMGIYLVNDTEELGPIRSARPYFITTLLEYDPIYVRAGGSEEAKEYIEQLEIADIDGLTNSEDAFFRNTKVGKKSPHNLYTNMENIRNAQIGRGYSSTGDYEGFNFYEKDTEIQGDNGTTIEIKYNRENSTSYIYNEVDRVYERYKDGEAHIDEYYNIPIVAKNIIIQQVKTKPIDNEGRLEIDLVDSGKGIYISNGKFKDISWTKGSKDGKTMYYDEEGEEIFLNKGITWIQIIDEKSDIIIE